ncbi:acyltransferase family-domain-containing protein [Rhexocercosporidium sp. MPI-PUGE-AT-0058]|nr:acyltransferase family-domain-containing protein [Rhexocercosporidium sp. MPI-PUGE-AT-0058]
MGLLHRLLLFLPSHCLHRYELLTPSDSSPNDDLGQEPKESAVKTSTRDIRIIGCAKAVGVFLTPSFLERNGRKVERRITETSYLNGVRGLAASLVYIQHLLYAHWLHNGYAGRPEDFIIQLPFLRLLFSGRFMVAIFFILSGYVLSYKPLQLARKGDTRALYDNLSSAAFRRTPRLFLPIVPAMFGTAIVIYFTCYGAENFTRDVCIPKASSLWRQIWDYVRVLFRLVDPSFWREYYPPGLPHLWTLPMEFRGSMVVFLIVLGLGNTRPLYRLGLLIIFALFFLHLGRWEIFLFTSGPILAEFRIYRKESSPEMDLGGTRSKKPFYLNTARTILWAGTFILGLFLGSWPAFQACDSHGFRNFCSLTPAQYSGDEVAQQYFWVSIGAFLLLLSFENLEILQRPFTTKLASYMGDISFGFYIVHWTMLFTVGTVIIGNCKRWLPYGYPNYSVGFFVGTILTTPFVVWVGDLHWRAFDNGAVRCARWLNTRCGRKLE